MDVVELDTDMERRSRTTSVDPAVAEQATRQHGVVSLAQLRALGLGAGAVRHRLETGRLHVLHRGVYAVGHRRLTVRSRWMAGVLACGEGAVLSHRSAAQLWGIGRAIGIEITAPGMGRRGPGGLSEHRSRLSSEDRAVHDGIPVTSVARTLFDLAEVVDATRVERAIEEADRLGLLQLRALERVCDRSAGRHSLKPVRALMRALDHVPDTRSELESLFAAFCRSSGLPPPSLNALVGRFLVDALWPAQCLVVELDGFAFHCHRAAFERDRARDAELQVAGYRVLRLTHRRLIDEPEGVAAQLRRFLEDPPG